MLLFLTGCNQGVSFSSTDSAQAHAAAERPDEPKVPEVPDSPELGKPVNYGLWEFGEVLGGDPRVCHTGESYNYEGLGCVIQEAACPSGQARATRMVDVYAPWHREDSGIALVTAKELTQLATALNRTESFLRNNLIRYWEYHCVE